MDGSGPGEQADEPRHVALVGMMGVGKTTVGRLLAERLGARLVDVDEAIEARTGRTVRQLWEDGGEAAYRPLERSVVAGALDATDPVVLATPGGVVVDDGLAAEVDRPGVVVVHLRATAETIVRRLGDDARHRPLLGDDPAAAITRLLRERAGRYEALASLSVDVDHLPAAEVVAVVADHLVDARRRPGRTPLPSGVALRSSGRWGP